MKIYIVWSPSNEYINLYKHILGIYTKEVDAAIRADIYNNAYVEDLGKLIEEFPYDSMIELNTFNNAAYITILEVNENIREMHFIKTWQRYYNDMQKTIAMNICTTKEEIIHIAKCHFDNIHLNGCEQCRYDNSCKMTMLKELEINNLSAAKFHARLRLKPSSIEIWSVPINRSKRLSYVLRQWTLTIRLQQWFYDWFYSRLNGDGLSRACLLFMDKQINIVQKLN